MKGIFKAQEELQQLKNEYKAFKNECELKEMCFMQKINEATKKCNIIVSGIDYDEVSKAKKILDISYNENYINEIHFLAEEVIKKFIEDPYFFKSKYMYTKIYAEVERGVDCRYSCSPTWGNKLCEIGLNRAYRSKNLTEDQKDTVIYYLKLLSEAMNLEYFL